MHESGQSSGAEDSSGEERAAGPEPATTPSQEGETRTPASTPAEDEEASGVSASVPSTPGTGKRSAREEAPHPLVHHVAASERSATTEPTEEEAAPGPHGQPTAVPGSVSPESRRRRGNRIVRFGLLGFGAFVVVGVEFAMLYPRIHRADSAPQHCLQVWNSASNGRARRALNIDAAGWAGTPLMRMRLSEHGGRCELAGLRGDGNGQLWRQSGSMFALERVTPTAADYETAVNGAARANVTLHVAGGTSLIARPDMGTLTTP